MTPEQQDPDRIDALEARVDALQRKLNAAIDRIDELESSGGGGGGPRGFDQYDQHVIDDLEPGKTLTLAELKRRYNMAGVRNDRKVKDRVSILTNSDLFESGTANQTWTFTGGSDD